MFGKKRSDKKTVRTGEDMPDLDNDALYAMSNTELLNEIEKLMSPPPGEDIDTDKVEQYLALLQDRAPVMEDYDPAAQWDKLMDEHPMLAEEATVSERLSSPKSSRSESGQGRRFRVVRMVEVAAVAVLCLVVTASAFGVNPIQSFLNWAEGVIQVYSNPSGVMELPADDPSEYHSLEEALAANGIDASGCPKWVPQDYSLFRVWVRAGDDITKYAATYESTRGELVIRVTQHSMSSAASAEEREDGGYIYTHDGVEYYIIADLEWAKAGWEDGLNSYVISGQISEEELKEIIDSIA